MRIMLVGDSTAVISGFGSALRNLATYLHQRGHTIAHLGWQTMGQERIASFHDNVLGYKVLPNIGGQQFGEMAFKYWLPKWKPDLVITLADFWMISYMFKMETNTPILMWYPIDGFPLTDQIVEMLKNIDYAVCMSEYGRDMVSKVGIHTKHIPHGVKSDVFTPKPEDVRAAMRRELGIPPGKIVVGRVDRNQTRKKIPRTIKAFVKLHKQFPDTVLYLHMDKRDREGWDLPYIVKRFGLTEGKDVFFPTPDMLANFMYGISEKRLAIIMSMIDIHLWLTGGEGFGLTGLETMSSGAVNVASNYTTPPELFQFGKANACGLPVKIDSFETGAAGVDRALADTDDAYEKMKWLLENRDEMAQLSRNGVARAKEHYDWRIVTENFDNIIRDLNITQIKYSMRDLQ
jgi:glycosyltransferase involved in cell wall biosynthesis